MYWMAHPLIPRSGNISDTEQWTDTNAVTEAVVGAEGRGSLTLRTIMG